MVWCLVNTKELEFSFLCSFTIKSILPLHPSYIVMKN